jgi:integrase/recombinase XerD
MFITKTKKSSYYQIVYRKNGCLTTKSTGTKNQKHAEIILEAFKNTFIYLTEPSNKLKSVRAKKFADEFIEITTLSCSKGYILRSVKPAFKHLMLHFGNIELGKISAFLGERFLLSHYQKSKHSALLYHRVFKAAFNKAVTWNYIESNPFVGFKLPKIQLRTPKFISMEELEHICDCTDREIFKDIFRFAFLTGMRCGEIINLTWDNIDLNNNSIQIGSESFITKSRKIRFIPIANPVKEILLDHPPLHLSLKSFYVFNKGNGVPYRADYLSKKFKRAVRSARLSEDIHFHSLRSSFGSLLLQKGVSISVISKLLGHSSISVTEKHYASLSFNNLVDAMDPINKLFNQY